MQHHISQFLKIHLFRIAKHRRELPIAVNGKVDEGLGPTQRLNITHGFINRFDHEQPNSFLDGGLLQTLREYSYTKI